ncbi:MAG TPA: hypothetical protein VL295_08350 [Gemmatimonadales bacterium]|nr:hypothetical protein [Gemmatimonadales bacterium]
MGRLDFGHRVRQWLPVTFEAYARILHPASIERKEGQVWTHVPVPWSEIGAWSGKELQPTTNMISLQVRADGVSWRDQQTEGEFTNGPVEGQLVRPQLDRLGDILAAATETPDTLLMLVWSGWGAHSLEALGHQELDVSTSLGSSGRRYFLCRGSFENAVPGEDGERVQEPPSFWWPADRAWFVSTDIDIPCTYVGGSASLAERIVGDAPLEAFPARLDDPLGGDPVPPP